MSDTDSPWFDVGPATDLTAGSSVAARAENGHQVAIFRTEDGELACVDNLCPHEGYPLVQGDVRGCVLTCAWHNYKFDLRDGTCVQGDEDVTRHEVRELDGRIQVRLCVTDQAFALPRHLASLTEALLEDDAGRMARDAVRVLRAGATAEDVLWHAAAFDAARAEYGVTHALAVAADLLRFLPDHPGDDAALPLTHALCCAAEANIRRHARPPADHSTVPGPGATGDQLAALVEAEEGSAAEGLLRDALGNGAPRDEVESWLLGICAAHFLSFGHGLIYTTKAFDLLDRVGWERAPDLLPGLLFKLVTSTREDTLPPMRVVVETLDRVTPDLPTWRKQHGSLGADAGQTLRAALLDGKRSEAQTAVADALRKGASPTAVLDVISRAAAERLLRFDPEIELDTSCQDGWLDATHAATYAHAVRHALARDPSPRALRSLFYAAHFVQRTKPLDLPPQARPTPQPLAGEADDVVSAIRAGDSDRALNVATGLLATGGVEPLFAALRQHALEAPVTRPIFAAHVIKMTIAMFDERAALPPGSGGDLPVLALVRFLASPLYEPRVVRAAHEARRFLIEGKPPRRLTQ